MSEWDLFHAAFNSSYDIIVGRNPKVFKYDPTSTYGEDKPKIMSMQTLDLKPRSADPVAIGGIMREIWRFSLL